MRLDTIILEWLHGWATSSPLAHSLVIFAADYLPWFIVGALIVYMLIQRAAAGAVLTGFVAGALAWWAAVTIKLFYTHPRPAALLDSIQPLVGPESGNSFPSSHAAFFFALAIGVAFSRGRAGNLLLVAALAVGAGRVAAGVHWPSDILAAFALALAVAILVKLALFKQIR